MILLPKSQPFWKAKLLAQEIGSSNDLRPALGRLLLQSCLPLVEQTKDPAEGWPDKYINRTTGKLYQAHHDEEQSWLEDRQHRYLLAKGGEGSGKSVVGIIKDLEWLRLGVTGILGSPDLQHFKKSLWPEFQNWCPWHMVVPGQQYRGRNEWQPHEPFILNFINGARLICGGFEEPGAWEGPNVTFAHFDEARRHKKPDMLKVLDGRVRIQIITDEGLQSPQLYMTTTPRKHWLYDYFGPPKGKDEAPNGDPYLNFKGDARTMTLRTEDNERAGNLAEGYTEKRAQSLTDSEKRVLLDAEWEDIDDIDRFLPSILWWDSCYDEALPPLTQREPMVIGLDGAISEDNFALIGITRHPLDRERLATRYSRIYKPGGVKLDFADIEADIVDLLKRFSVVLIAYDPAQVHYLITRLEKLVWCEEFSQHSRRIEADVQLLDMIKARMIAHDGSHTDLRQHLDNADRKKILDTPGKFRIVKRTESQKIDGSVALSMACHAFLDKLSL